MSLSRPASKNMVILEDDPFHDEEQPPRTPSQRLLQGAGYKNRSGSGSASGNNNSSSAMMHQAYTQVPQRNRHDQPTSSSAITEVINNTRTQKNEQKRPAIFRICWILIVLFLIIGAVAAVMGMVLGFDSFNVSSSTDAEDTTTSEPSETPAPVSASTTPLPTPFPTLSPTSQPPAGSTTLAPTSPPSTSNSTVEVITSGGDDDEENNNQTDWVLRYTVSGDTASGDYFGHSMAWSGDSYRLAIGAPRIVGAPSAGTISDFEDLSSGYVRLYHGGDDFRSYVTLMGKYPNDEFGYSVDMNNKGTIVAIGGRQGGANRTGYVEVYKRDVDDWVQMGQTLYGIAGEESTTRISEFFGYSVGVEDFGIMTVLAVGAPNRNGPLGPRQGIVETYVYMYQSDTWEKTEQDLWGESGGDFFGISLDLKGGRLAVGGPNNEGGVTTVDGAATPGSGHVRVYDFGDREWHQVGQDLDGQISGSFWGNAISLSYDATTVAIGAPRSVEDRGEVHVLRYSTDGNWTLVGQIITGGSSFDQFGQFVSLSADGKMLAVGAMGLDEEGAPEATNHGGVEIFHFLLEEWRPVGSPILGEERLDLAGGAGALSNSGSRVAIASFTHNSESGHVRLFELDQPSL